MKLAIVAATLAEAIWLLLLLEVNPIHCSSGTDAPSEKTCVANRKHWKTQRAVRLAELESVKKNNEGSVNWMTGGNVDYGTPCNASSDPDPCVAGTIAVHYYKENKASDAPDAQKRIVISDLSLALKCVNGNCTCAEDEAEPIDIDGFKRCLILGKKKYQECIHDMECKGAEKGFQSCIFNAQALEKQKMKENGDCGEIEDMRRFCSGSKIALPSIILLSAFLLSLGLIYL